MVFGVHKKKEDKFEKQNQKKLQKKRRQENYDRVYALHEQAEFLCYINDVYKEKYQGRDFVKLEGLVAKGIGKTEDTYLLFSCYGVKKADVHMEELYNGNSKVKQLEGGDKRVALYPKEQDVFYKAGDILCKLDKAKDGIEKGRIGDATD